MREIILATRNEGKVREFNHAFEGTDIIFVSLLETPQAQDIDESGDTYEENALIKARSIAEHTGKPAVADDSGIEIDAMPGELGVRSARFEKGKSASEINEIVLARLKNEKIRSTRYICALAFVNPSDTREIIVTGQCEGLIHDRQLGNGGFGFDPIFYIPEFGKTMAELPLDVKNRISHRAKAIEKLKALIA